MKIRGGLFLAFLLPLILVAPAAQASSGLRVAQAAPAQPATSSPSATDQTAPQAADPDPAQADPQAADADETVGNVAKLKGTATVTRNGTATPLKLNDDIFKGDVLQTGKNAALTVTFIDDTTLDLSASSRIVVDNFVFQDGAKDNAALINVTRGTMAFVAAAVAKTGDMKIETPTATLGIRGTTGVVEVPEGATASSATGNVGVKLYPDADGRVGRIEVRSRDGAPLGMLTQAASGFTLRGTMVSGFGMRMTAMPMVMSPQMIARDRGFVQRVHTMQGIGRNIVMQQRNFRLQNPRQPGFGRPGFNQPGQQRPGFNQPGQRGGFNQPGRNLPGQPDRPGMNQPGQRGNLQPGRPGLPNQGGLQRPPGAPGQYGQRPGLPPRAGLPPRPGYQQGASAPYGVPRQTGLPGGYQRPPVGAGIPGIPGGAGGIINRLGVPGQLGAPGRLGVPSAPSQRMPSAMPRAGQSGSPAAPRRPPPPARQRDQRKDSR